MRVSQWQRAAAGDMPVRDVGVGTCAKTTMDCTARNQRTPAAASDTSIDSSSSLVSRVKGKDP